MNAKTLTLPPEVKTLRARRRHELPTDEFITEYDGVDDDGHKYEELAVPGPEGSTETIESDLTAAYQPGPSTTTDLETVRIEAELLADGVDLENPHIPASEELLKRAREYCEENDLPKPWEHRL